MGLCQRLIDYAVRPTDSPEERFRKELTIPVLCVLFVLTSIVQLSGALGGGQVLISYAYLGSFFVACGGGMIWILTTRSLSTRAIGVIGLVSALGVVLSDWASIASNDVFRPWSFVVLIMDLYLATNAPKLYQSAALILTTLWLAVAAVEQAFVLGINSIDGWNNRPEEATRMCDCASPPCAFGLGALVVNFPCILLILLLDFHATRGFSEGMRSQQAEIVSSVHVAERVAQLLAAYATDDARRVVAEEGSSLPEALCASYEQLLDNLDSYRVFLPDSLLFAAKQQQQQLEDNETDGLDSQLLLVGPSSRDAPGLGEGFAEMAVCFTDIQSSTELWEAYPQGMYEGLNIHNDLMRITYTTCNGYEVKTIGDSFMVAFDTGLDALRFGLEAQLGLLRQRWPEDLLCHPLCMREPPAGEPLWGGLRVRIGVHCGPVRAEVNPVTGRCDYFGHTVNTAARLEAVLRKGGLVAASDAVVKGISPDGLGALGSPVVHNAGLRELKGVTDPRQVWALVPQSLRGRIDVLRDDSAVVSLLILSPASAPSEVTTASLGLTRGQSFNSNRSQSLRQERMTPRIALRLEQSVGTCAVARTELRQIAPIAERLPIFASAAARAADQTQGVVDSLLSACLTVTWNASRPCPDHTAACRRFIAAPFRAPCHLGATSGYMLHGSVTTGRRSFATVIGGCIELAAALAEEAERCGDVGLVTGAVGADCAAAGIAFSAQLWQSAGDPVLTVLAVRQPEKDVMWSFDSVPLDKAALDPGSEFAELFFKACAAAPDSEEEAAVLGQLREMGAGELSEPARLLAERITRGWVRSRPMPPLWEGEGNRRTSVALSVRASSPRGNSAQ